jgi:hypothetical protein
MMCLLEISSMKGAQPGCVLPTHHCWQSQFCSSTRSNPWPKAIAAAAGQANCPVRCWPQSCLHFFELKAPEVSQSVLASLCINRFTNTIRCAIVVMTFSRRLLQLPQ